MTHSVLSAFVNQISEPGTVAHEHIVKRPVSIWVNGNELTIDAGAESPISLRFVGYESIQVVDGNTNSTCVLSVAAIDGMRAAAPFVSKYETEGITVL